METHLQCCRRTQNAVTIPKPTTFIRLLATCTYNGIDSRCETLPSARGDALQNRGKCMYFVNKWP